VIRLLPLLFLLSTIYSSQTTVNQDSSYYLITTNNDTTKITWYRISYYFSYSFCEYQTVNNDYKKIKIDELSRIENSSGLILYPDDGFKKIGKYTQSKKKPIQKNKGWRIIGGISFNKFHSREKYNNKLCFGFEKPLSNFILGLQYKERDRIRKRVADIYHTYSTWINHIYISAYSLYAINIAPTMVFLTGFEYNRTLFGIYTYDGIYHHQDTNYKYQKQFNVNLDNFGFLLGTDLWFSKKIGLRILYYYGFNNINNDLSILDTYGHSNYKYREFRFSPFYNL